MKQTDKEVLDVKEDEWDAEKLANAAQRLREIIARFRSVREAKAQKEIKIEEKDLLD